MLQTISPGTSLSQIAAKNYKPLELTEEIYKSRNLIFCKNTEKYMHLL